MAGKQVAGAGLPESIAGMSKNQLYDIMSQMKVFSFAFTIRINIGSSLFSSAVFGLCLRAMSGYWSND